MGYTWKQCSCLTREIIIFLIFAPCAFMFVAQHGIGENICVFCLTEPNNSDVRNYYICFPFGEIVCANAARMKKKRSYYGNNPFRIYLCLSPFFQNMQLQNIWLLTVKAVIIHLHTNYFPSTHSLWNMCNSSSYIVAYTGSKKGKCVNKKFTKAWFNIFVAVIILDL